MPTHPPTELFLTRKKLIVTCLSTGTSGMINDHCQIPHPFIFQSPAQDLGEGYSQSFQ